MFNNEKRREDLAALYTTWRRYNTVNRLYGGRQFVLTVRWETVILRETCLPWFKTLHGKIKVKGHKCFISGRAKDQWTLVGPQACLFPSSTHTHTQTEQCFSSLRNRRLEHGAFLFGSNFTWWVEELPRNSKIITINKWTKINHRKYWIENPLTVTGM